MTTAQQAENENGEQHEQPASAEHDGQEAAERRREAAKAWFADHIGWPPKFRPVAEARMNYARHGDYTHPGQRPIRRTIGVIWGGLDTGKKWALCYFDWLTEEPGRFLFSLIATLGITTAAAQIPYVGDLVGYVPVLHYFDITSWFA